MNLSRGSKASWPAALISLIIVNVRSCDAETSGEYLQKVMIELQELNVPSNSLTMHDRLSMNLDYPHAGYHARPDNTYRKLSSDSAHQDIKQQDTQKPTASVPADLTHSAANNIAQYYAVRDPTAAASYPKVKKPEPLAFTRAELAALYKKALEKGSAISVASLTQALNAAGGNGNALLPASLLPASLPQIGQLQSPTKYPMYNYYFFPLKSFASELQRDQHQAAIAPVFAATETAESPQKQLMNPLFVAIGTFISMALLFMMSVLFLPKLPQLPQFELFNARTDNDDLMRLTALVMNAIDGRNRWKNFSTAG
ncbi:uncharacterized protein [Linepithema humile]|uniref:uncharacterized protein n=1 Tax=Linepithema humile TaxID=83485 RepID=UPI0006233174|nr:PREDICTED: uncharacterized protein LOC105668480 [Linepithema humile]XP_012216323.1 PREDICTED: uncharacterized protein LOC105668480 [Linepithema humile]